MGMERMVAILEWLDGQIPTPDPFQTELFKNIISTLENLSYKKYELNKKSMRIIADHVRAATFVIADGVIPSNKERGYVLRKLIRRAIRHGQLLGIKENFLADLADKIINNYKNSYPELQINSKTITNELETEEHKFRQTLERGLKEITKQKKLSGKIAFDLYQSYGFPLELTVEIAKEKGQKIDQSQFEEEFKKHQELSRTSTRGIFKGGLQDQSEITTRLHTATHLLQQALRVALGDHVRQKGSHITAERLRFDFSHPTKLTTDELKRVEDLVNEKIKENLPVSVKIVPLSQALSQGALTVLGAKYPEKVKVYSISNFSKEVCGGPHVDFTGSLGSFKIIKEEASGSGIRRIYAILGF
jgi:alanyl-tRNA synthetase